MSIFDRHRPTASQLRTVADRRFDDAKYLLESRRNKYANGSMYLVGFVVECRLKARLVETRPEVVHHDARAGEEQRRLRALLFGHDLDGLLAAVPEVIRSIQRDTSEETARRLIRHLQQVCGTWSIFARYSSRQESIQEARIFFQKVAELRSWL